MRTLPARNPQKANKTTSSLNEAALSNAIVTAIEDVCLVKMAEDALGDMGDDYLISEKEFQDLLDTVRNS
ncbi:MAG: hypothetical protein ACNYPH_00395 [Gammaproteobacteria bacterium WSBS_2016_MAG_OTU1]